MTPAASANHEASRQATCRLVDRLASEAREQQTALARAIAGGATPPSLRAEAYAALHTPPPGGAYSRLAPALLNAQATLQTECAASVPLFNAYLLAHALACFDLGGGTCKLPASVENLYPGELQRILSRIRRVEACDLGDDTYLKDLAILDHRLIPVGAEFASPASGIPRRLLFSNGIGQFLRGCRLLATVGGARPFFELHAHVLSLSEFHPTGWERTYVRLAELLALNPDVRGWMSSSWFLDPALRDISPRLTYLREVPTRHGATLLFVGPDHDGSSGALARSGTRRRLFDEGRYVPAIYMRVWPRASMLRWLAKARAADTSMADAA